MTPKNRVYAPREFRVSMVGRLCDAHLISPNAPLPPLRKHNPEPAATTGLKPATAVENSTTAMLEITRQLAADRQLIESSLDNLRTVLAEQSTQHRQQVEQWQSAVVEMALAITAKLLHREVLQGEFPIENMIREMSQQLYDDPVVRVRLNPKDLELLEQRLDGQPLMSKGADPQLVADPSLGRAECRLDGQSTMMMADLSAQVRQIREDLMRSLHDARS
jgi:flagellar biosynthesis/type III secretory pathway protein FliH